MKHPILVTGTNILLALEMAHCTENTKPAPLVYSLISLFPILNSQSICYHKSYNLTYAAAAYHDLGLKIDREHHELASGEIVGHDTNLSQFFTPAEIRIIREAVEDHRGSRKIPPRNFYGKIISDSDRDFDIKVLAPRQLATSIKNYPNLCKFDEHFERCYDYMLERTKRTGHFHLWTGNPVLAARRDQFEKDYRNRDLVYRIYLEAYKVMERDGIISKIQNYYEDF